MNFKNLLRKSLLMGTTLLVGTSGAWADTETVTVLSENYESYAVGDITSTMTSNGWTFKSRNGKNEIKIVQGADPSVNTTKYFDFYYPDGGASRNQSWNFGTSSSLNVDNWKLTFSAALNPGTNNSSNKFYIIGNESGNVTSDNGEVTNYLLALVATAAASTEYTPSIGSTSYTNITLTSGTWYKFLIEATAITETTATIHVKITSYDGTSTIFEQTVANMSISAIGTLKGLCWNSPRGYSRLNLDDVLLTKEVDASVCADPTWSITGPDGTSRKFTLACETAGSTIYYATSNLEKGAAGWETYTSGEVTTAATTIYVYAEKGTKSSNIVNFTTGAGTAITLNAPTVYVNNLIANGSYYNAQFGAWYNTAGVEFTPDAELSATFAPEGGSPSNVTLPYTATQKGTLTITSTADGFTSAQTVLSVPGLYEQSWQSVDFSSLSGTDAIGTAVSGTWTLLDSHGRWASWADGTYNFYQHGTGSSSTVTVNDKIRMREVVVLAEGMGLGRNVTSGENISVITTTGQIVGFEMYNGYGAAINKGVNTYKTYGINTSGNPSVGVTNGALLVQATIYAPATLTLADGDAIHLTFNNATLGTGTAYGENWKIDFYSGNTKVANARADWWDDVANNNSGYTYGYTYSSDGGATADNTNVWGTYMSDMADADIDLTLSNSEGTLYVIGTMTKGEKVYYVNFAKSGLSGNLTYNLYGNNATLSNITTTDASVVTTPVHPTNVAVTLGSNGYATYANNVYPLDLTSAKAYKAAVDGSKVKFTLFEQAVPAGTGMLVEGTPSGTVNLPIADASTAVAGNEFLVNASGAVFDAESGYNYFALIKDSNPLTFGTFAPGTLAFPANKTYLKVAASAGARLLAVFGDDETTGISQMESGKLNIENAVYNLNGQRVAQPTKGLYIVGGKKVMMK